MLRSKLSRRLAAIVAAATFATFGPISAQASLTTVKPPKPSEMGIEQILENTYGGNFSLVGNNYTNGSITANRIDDSLDQVWHDGKFDINAKAKFSGYSQSLGYETAGGGSTHHLLDVTGFGLGAIGSITGVSIHESDFAFVRSGDSGTQTSQDALNSDARDHMVTFQIDGVGNPDTWMLFFEDLNVDGHMGNRSYADFNDLAVELTRTGVAAPLPPAVLSGGLILAGNFIVTKLRKKRA